jgi:hypothetical protein
MIYKKYEGEIPFKVGDIVTFYDWNNGEKILRRGIVRRIDENGFEYNLHLKCEYVCPLGNSAVVYPLRQKVNIIKEGINNED